MEPEKPAYLTDQQLQDLNQQIISTEYLTKEDKDTILNDGFASQAKMFKAPIIIQGANKAGKSILCNQLMNEAIINEGRGKQRKIKGLCPINTNPMTAIPIEFRCNPHLQGHFILGQKNILSKSNAQIEKKKSLEKNLQNYGQVEKAMEANREKIKKLKKCEKQLQQRESQYDSDEFETKINDPGIVELKREIQELRLVLRKMLCIQSSFTFFEQPELNRFITLIDTVGSDDKVHLDTQVLKPQGSQWCDIYCMDLSNGFNQSHSEAIIKLYDGSSIPQSILFSFNLCKYLRSQNNEGIQNVSEFLQQFFQIIPNQFIDIFRGLKSKMNSSIKDQFFNSLSGERKRIYESKVKFYDQSIQILQGFLERVEEYDKQTLMQLAVTDTLLPQEIVDAFPFHLMKFHGKALIANFSEQKIMNQIFDKGDKRLAQNMKKILKNSIFEGLSKIEESRDATFKQIQQKLDLKVRQQYLSKTNIDRLIKFRYNLDQRVAETIRKINQNMNLKKNQILEETLREVQEFLEKIQRQGLSGKSYYIFRSTIKDDNQHALQKILNGTTSKLTTVIKNVQKGINLESLKQIQQSLEKVIDEKLQSIMKKYFEIACNVLTQKILKEFAKFIEQYNQALKEVKADAWKQCQLNLKIITIDFEILNMVLDSLKVVFSAFLGVWVVVAEVAIRITTAVLGSVAIVGTLLAQGIVTHFWRKSQDKKWIPKQENAYKQYLRSLPAKIESLMMNNFVYVLEQQIQEQQKSSLKDCKDNSEQLKQKILGLQSLKKVLSKRKMSQKQQWQKIKELL